MIYLIVIALYFVFMIQFIKNWKEIAKRNVHDDWVEDIIVQRDNYKIEVDRLTKELDELKAKQ